MCLHPFLNFIFIYDNACVTWLKFVGGRGSDNAQWAAVASSSRRPSVVKKLLHACSSQPLKPWVGDTYVRVSSEPIMSAISDAQWCDPTWLTSLHVSSHTKRPRMRCCLPMAGKCTSAHAVNNGTPMTIPSPSSPPPHRNWPPLSFDSPVVL